LIGNKRFEGPKLVAQLLIELASLKLQTHNFLVKKRDSCGVGLNPKLPSDMACAMSKKIEEVWEKCSSFKTTNTTLNLESTRRKSLKKLRRLRQFLMYGIAKKYRQMKNICLKSYFSYKLF
jgi:hypothetical protein